MVERQSAPWQHSSVPRHPSPPRPSPTKAVTPSAIIKCFIHLSQLTICAFAAVASARIISPVHRPSSICPNVSRRPKVQIISPSVNSLPPPAHHHRPSPPPRAAGRACQVTYRSLPASAVIHSSPYRFLLSLLIMPRRICLVLLPGHRD